ncbi:signal peptidase II [Paenirhodobacter populi]|uniref:Lipoprotein signal peptidase n=1 Tax=Paenirhodobacter populi TaxID=2306993 RepID=A0A443K2L7_9RHOB|nr:signal peptidase II [Sinirhodobacter populi]RWR06628.1 signal peptidase II [Sinirhodobacter populi]RWR26996.1 signal peptidase II [Sinirhodobacter populi]
MRLTAWVAAGVFLLDQISKYIVVHLMNLDRLLVIEVLPPWLNFHMAWNQGVNFGLMAGEGDLTRWVLIALSLVITGWVWIWVRRERHSQLMLVSAGLLIGGALGNVIDRLVYGAVADFLNMSLPFWRNPWSFNVADIAIFAGAVGLVLFSGKGDGAAKKPRPKSDAKARR